MTSLVIDIKTVDLKPEFLITLYHEKDCVYSAHDFGIWRFARF